MFNLSNVISFFKENINSSQFKFDSLNTIQENTQSEFIKDSVIQTLYAYIADRHITFSKFLGNQDVTAFLMNYTNEVEKYKKHSNEVNKIKNMLLGNNSNITNANDLIPYVIIESLIDFYDAKKYVIQKNNSNDNKFYSNYFEDVIKLTNSYDFINSFQNKPFGFYICKAPTQQYSSLFSGDKYIIVGNQPNALYFYELNCDIKKEHGFNSYNLSIENDIFRKRHNFKIEVKESDNNELSTDIKKSLFIDTTNELIFKCFLYWCETMKAEVTTKGFIGYNKSEKTNFPVVSNLESQEIRDFTFEELRFKGEYAFLSFLDDLFEDIIDMSYINYYSDNLNHIHKIQHVSEEINFDLESNYSFDKSFFNNFKIDIVEKSERNYGSNFSLTPINPYYFGEKEDIQKYNLNVAKLNKLKVYYMYLRVYLKQNKTTLENDMQSFFTNNVNDFIHDHEFIKLINVLATGNISDRNLKEHFLYAQIPNVLTIPDVRLVNNNGIGYSIYSVKDLNITDYKQTSKAKKLIGFDIHNIDIWNYFENKFNTHFSKETNVIISLFKAYHLLEEVKNKKNISKISNIVDAFSYDCDIELFKWNETDRLVRVFVPMNDKNYKDFTDHLEVVKPEKIINCNFGYSNGSQWFR